MSKTFRIATGFLAGSCLALAACGSDPEPASTDEVTDPMPGPDGSVVAGVEPRVAGEEPNVALLGPIGDAGAIELGDVTGSCSFEYDGESILIAGAENVENARGKGVIRVNGEPRVLTGSQPRGASEIEAGPSMTDGEYEVSIDRGEGQGKQWRATLTASKQMDDPVTYDGVWDCSV